jgi:hypothetical protein
LPNNAAPPIDTGTVCQESTRAELDRLRATDTPEGQSAMALAAAIDSGRSLMALPAMTDALARRLDELRERIPKAKDTTDEFAARREARRRAAGF